MKAILVTETNKQANKEFFKGNAIGSIVAKQLPLRYNGVVISNGGNYPSRTDLHLLDGFKDLVQPVFDSLTHKRGNEIIEHPSDETKCTYTVVELTQQKIEANAQAQLDSDEAQTKVNERKAKGVEDFDRLMAIIERKWRSNEFSANTTNNTALAKGARDYFYNALLPITYGLWDIAQTRLSTVPNTQNQTLLNLHNAVKSQVDAYVSETFNRKAK